MVPVPISSRNGCAATHITFEANPNYWGEKAKVQTLIFR